MSIILSRRILLLSAVAFVLAGLLGGWVFLSGESRKGFRARTGVRILWLKAAGELPHVSWNQIYTGMRSPLLRFFRGVIAEGNQSFSAKEVKVGGDLFRTHCVTCHGERGVGGTGPTLTEVGQAGSASDAALLAIISEGIPGKMPGVSLSEPQRWGLVAFVRAIRSGTVQSAVEARSQVHVPYERLLRAEKEPENWLTYSGNYNGQRYSTLNEIQRDNVADLRLSWVLQLRTTQKVETTPLVVDGVAYLTRPPNDVLAVDTRTGKQIWTYRYPVNLETVNICCGPSNRGLALLNDKAYMGTLDGKLVALNTTSGKLVWMRDVARPIEGYAITSAPLAVKDKIIVGVTGGEFGARGFLDAYDAETGERAWRFWTVPGPGEPGHETWEQEGSWKTGGAPTWLTGSFDPELNLVYWGTGNPGPPWIGDIRGGDNLYSNSVVALDADTGALKWHFQFTPHDVWDWDSNQVPVLVDGEFAGRPRKLMLWPNRNAFFYVLDRVTGEFLLAEPFTKQTWAKGISESGRPIVKSEAVPSPEGTIVYPGFGATNWYSPSYSPQTDLLYVTVIDEYSETFYSGGGLFGPGAEFTGIYPTLESGTAGWGAVRAVVPETGKVQWEYRLPQRNRAGVLSTAGGLVFSGSEDGAFFALDARTGEELWQAKLGGYVVTAPITYLSDGKQQLLITVGGAVFAFELPASSRREERAPDSH